MSTAIWGFNLVPATILFLTIHLIVGTIRGIHRYRMIEKYQYDYYNGFPLKLFGRLGHNWFYGTFALKAFFISIFLTIMVLFAANLP
jgi:hypothetical protein